MRDIRRAMKLKDDGLSISRPRDYFFQVFQRPIWIGVACGRNQQRMIAFGIVGSAKLQGTIVRFRLFSAPSKFVTQLGQSLHRLGPNVFPQYAKLTGFGTFGFVFPSSWSTRKSSAASRAAFPGIEKSSCVQL